jgi:hypothetical protein
MEMFEIAVADPCNQNYKFEDRFENTNNVLQKNAREIFGKKQTREAHKLMEKLEKKKTKKYSQARKQKDK